MDNVSYHYLYRIRYMKVGDIVSIHRMYDLLSENSKRFFHPGFVGYENVGLKWFLFQILLFLSSVKFLRETLLRIFPYAVLFPLVAVDSNNNVVGFAYLKIRKRLPNGYFSATLGIVINELHRGKRLGSKLMENLLRIAQQEGIREILLTVSSDNIKSIRLYEKYGFKKIGRTLDSWREKTFESIVMRKVM